MADEYVIVRMKLQDARRFQAEAAGTATSIKSIGAAADTTNRSLHESEARSWAMSQAMFTLRRAAYAATLAVGALGAGTVLLGLQYNMAMENNTVAFTQFLGSQAAAQKELGMLYETAAKTPFEFTQITDAARKFLAFGFSVKQTNSYLGVIGDTMAAFGLGAEGIDRAVLAFGQMQAKGRIMGEEILQLTELGIPAVQILAEQLGLTTAQVAKIGETGLKASVGIPALMRGMQERFKGMAALQAKTLSGQLSTLHDYAAQFAGALTLPLAESLRKDVIPALNELLPVMGKAFEDRGLIGAIEVLDKRIGANGALVDTFASLERIAYATSIIFTQALLPAVQDVYGVFKPLNYVLTGVSFGLVGASHTTLVLRYAIEVLVFWMAIEKGALLVRVTYLKASAFWTAINAAVTTRWRNAIILARLWLIALNLLIFQYTAGTKLAVLATRLWTWALFMTRMAVFELTTAIYAIPIVGWILLAISALVLLYFKWQWFHDKVDATYHLFKDHWPTVMAVALLPILGPIAFVITALDLIGNKLQWIYDKATAVTNAVAAPFEWAGGIFDSPGGGASVNRFSGTINAGATRAGSPNPLTSDQVSGARGRIHTHVYLDKRQIAEAVEEHNSDVRARH